MSSLLQNTPAGRIAAAIILSLLVHAALLFGPDLVQVAPIEPPLPPLVARLEPLPKPALKAHPKPKPHVAHKPEAARAAAKAPEPVAEPATKPAAEPAAEPAEKPAAEPAEKPAAEEMPPAEIATPAYPLPKHAELTFTVYKGTGFAVGEARHRLDIDQNGHYTLQVGMNTTGLARIFKTFEMSQQSRGTVGANGLRPDEFDEIRTTSAGKQNLSASFDWQSRLLSFSSGNSTPLSDQTQDILSFLYQFSQMRLDQAELPMQVSNGKKLERYRVEVGSEEEIDTPMGKLRALPLRKIHAPGEEGLEIWLGLEYRLLPVQIRQIDRNGEIAGQMVISSIRVSDD